MGSRQPQATAWLCAAHHAVHSPTMACRQLLTDSSEANAMRSIMPTCFCRRRRHQQQHTHSSAGSGAPPAHYLRGQPLELTMKSAAVVSSDETDTSGISNTLAPAGTLLGRGVPHWYSTYVSPPGTHLLVITCAATAGGVAASWLLASPTARTSPGARTPRRRQCRWRCSQPHLVGGVVADLEQRCACDLRGGRGAVNAASPTAATAATQRGRAPQCCRRPAATAAPG